MRDSKVVLKWIAEGKAEGRAEGWTEGWTEGWVEGWALGQLEGRREDLARLVQARFRVPLPPDLAAAAQAITDPDELLRWLVAAVTVPFQDAFRQAVLADASRPGR